MGGRGVWGFWPKVKNTSFLCLPYNLDRSQSLFDFVPQEKGLIWRPLWGRKNMGKSIFHWEDGPPWGKMHPNWCSNMPRIKLNLSEFFYVHFSGRRSPFSEGHTSFAEKCTNLLILDFSGSRFIFVTTSISHIPTSSLLHCLSLHGRYWCKKTWFRSKLDQSCCIFYPSSAEALSAL